jgi:hypothetical protein
MSCLPSSPKAFLLLLGTLLVRPQSALSQTDVSPSNLTSQLTLLRGQPAIDFLNRPSTKAIDYPSISKLRETLLRDSDLAIDANSGRPVYTCSMSAPPNPDNLKLQSMPPVNATEDEILASVPRNEWGLPLLSSRPNSDKTILLVFNGCADGWYNGPIPPYDPAGNGANFTDGEASMAVTIWRGVAEDFSVFDVDVTTIDRGRDSIISNYNGDPKIGIRACIGGAANVGGIAYLNSVGWSTPVLIFPGSLSNVWKYIWEATSHEVGHALGLYHDGDPGNEYHAGNGLWAPIMGKSYYGHITQFSKGEYPGATNSQDDFAVMSRYLTPLPDDHGDSFSEATLMRNGTAVAGLIGVNDATDYFKIFVEEGSDLRIKVDVTDPWPSRWGSVGRSNLDVLLSIYNSTFDLVALSNPINTVEAEIRLSSLPRGMYFVSVAKTGKTSEGETYSSYGSVGPYQISAEFIEYEPPEPLTSSISSVQSTETAMSTSSYTLTSTSSLPLESTEMSTSSTRLPTSSGQASTSTSHLITSSSGTTSTSRRTSTTSRLSSTKKTSTTIRSSSRSPTKSSSTLKPTTTPTLQLNAPALLLPNVFKNKTHARITLDWTDKSNNETIWEVSRCEFKKCSVYDWRMLTTSKTKQNVNVNASAAIFVTLGKTYEMKVRACAIKTKCGSWSAAAVQKV